MNHSDDDVHHGRTILTALYLCMLGVCFVVPIFFYFRMHCDDRHNRRLRELEIAGITQAMAESQDLHREESRAARRKYREERRARILQLFTPVRMILTENSFLQTEVSVKNDKEDTISCDLEAPSSFEIGGDNVQKATTEPRENPPAKGAEAVVDKGNQESEDEIDSYILIPKPGLQHGGCELYSNNLIATNNNNRSHDINEMRQVPNECSICLCEYEAGSDVVWSSNPRCEHCFHADCIEQWLMKQREPLCPVCRRDFVLDPFDVGPEEEKIDLESGVRHSSEAVDEESFIESRTQSYNLQQHQEATQQQQQQQQQREVTMSQNSHESSDESNELQPVTSLPNLHFSNIDET